MMPMPICIVFLSRKDFADFSSMFDDVLAIVSMSFSVVRFCLVMGLLYHRAAFVATELEVQI